MISYKINAKSSFEKHNMIYDMKHKEHMNKNNTMLCSAASIVRRQVKKSESAASQVKKVGPQPTNSEPPIEMQRAHITALDCKLREPNPGPPRLY